MKRPASRPKAQSVWLDTDIGDDTDDIFALALICASPELALAGVSTVFGETKERARLAQTLLALTGSPAARAPVVAGCGHPLPGQASPLASPVFSPNGPMARGPISQLPCARPASSLPRARRQHAVDALAAHLRRHPGKTVPVTIGALTNLATLLLREPKLQRAIPRLVVMGGEFKHRMWEWNIRCDPLAAACVVDSGLPIDFISWSIGMDCTVTAAQVAQLFAGRSRTSRLLARAVRLWRKSKSSPSPLELPHLFDPMAVSVLLHPEWFEWRRGRVEVLFTPAKFSHTRFTPDAAGPHRVAWKVQSRRAVAEVWDRILSL
jgi:purine nucleosidase/pyrimidine-specific ribonucleoside hydrolase